VTATFADPGGGLSDTAERAGVIERPGGTRLFGRETEFAAIDKLLGDARRSRGGALVFRGDAGAGKSALLEAASHRASDTRVLRVVGVEPEMGLAFAALHRLLRPVLDSIERIPGVQAHALRVAMGISPGATENKFLIALAVLSLVSELAAKRPMLCLVDDAQWLDRPSADALAFVARRLESEAIAMLFSARDDVARWFAGAGLPERTIGGLASAEAEGLLLDRFGDGIAPEVRRIIVDSAQGIPLALLETPTALTRAQLLGHDPLPRPMPMGHQLEQILLTRVHRLEPPAQLLLLVAAAEGSGDAEVVLSTGKILGIRPSALMEAEASGLIRSDGTALLFRHPVLRSAIYQEASLPRRQAVHRALVDVLIGEANADRRAWHRAALVLYPNDEVADELEGTAERARRRGGHAAAAGALRRSAELTSSDERRARRLVAAARAAWDAGLPDEASVLLRAAEGETDIVTHAELRHVQGEIEFNCGRPLRGASLLIDGAERVAATDPRKALQMLFDAAQCANLAADTSVMAAIGRTASTLPVIQTREEASLVDLLVGATAMLEAKDTRARRSLVRTLDRIADATDPRWLTWAGAAAALVGDHSRDEAFRRRADSIARSEMAVGTLAMVLARTAWTELFNYGRIVTASRHAEEGLHLALEAGLTNAVCFHRSILAWVAAVRGDDERCTTLADQASETALAHGLAAHNATANWAVGMLHLGHRRWDAAAARLESVWSFAPGAGHPYIALRAIPDLVEAAARGDRVELAHAATTRLSEYAEDAPQSVAALAARCRALTADGYDAREGFLSEALLLHDRDPRPFDRARTLLLAGENLRRQRRRAEARAPLRTALDGFEQVNARPWSDRASRELRATGQTVRRRNPASGVELTRQEQQVARMVADGATNREVAAQLFISPRTVEYHLRSVFSKLGISSRSELAPLLVEDSAQSI
jgi:DNA-binding CsgD family transcriptional regulator